ncbi:MAG: calcium/sodium antiporter [Thermoflexaceae bacterium]|nr:calcium/sodium antiporter [Thermoflexaceae bacterium]
MLLNLLLLVVGFVLLVKGADFFVEGSAAVARTFRVPSIIIGLTIVAMGTSAPELAVSVTAGLAGKNEIAISNVIGSNVFNLLVVVGACAAILPMNVDRKILKKEFPFVLIIQAVLLFFCANSFMGKIFGNVNGQNVLSRLEGIILVILFLAFMINMVLETLKSRKETAAEEEEEKKLGILISIVYIVGGAAAIVYGGDLVVDSASFIAETFGFSQTFIGLTVVAIGTSLPELVTSLTAIHKGENDLALGNVLGSNLFNILFVLALSTTLTPIKVLGNNIIDLIFLVVVSGLVYVFCLGKQKVSRMEGVTMVGIYIFYTVYLLMR